MLSSFAKFLFALASLSPVALTWAVADYGKSGFRQEQVVALGAGALVALICWLVLKGAERSLTKVSFGLVEIKAVDNEVVAFIVTYLFPLTAPAENVSLYSQLFVLTILAFVLSTSNAFTFNPLLTLMKYHFYEAKCSNGISYILLAKKDITDVRQVTHVGRLSKNLMLHLS